jgi:hypothetical protein
VGPGRLDQQPAGRAVAGLGEAAASDARTAGMLARHQPKIAMSWRGIGKTREVAQFSDAALTSVMPALSAAPPQPGPASRPAVSLQSAPSADRAGPRRLDCLNVILEHDMMRRLLKAQIRQPPAMQPGPGRPPIMATLAQHIPPHRRGAKMPTGALRSRRPCDLRRRVAPTNWPKSS